MFNSKRNTLRLYDIYIFCGSLCHPRVEYLTPSDTSCAHTVTRVNCVPITIYLPNDNNIIYTMTGKPLRILLHVHNINIRRSFARQQ